MPALVRLAACAAAAAVMGCGGAAARANSGEIASPMQQTSVDRDTARARAATAAFRNLDAAVAAGYARTVARCIAHPEHGAMGYHHSNGSLMDDNVEVERPEILVYSRLAGGEYVLNGVEYIVPFTARPRDARPPRVMGQALKPSDALGLWYLHVWVWKPNPSGLFADWNPTVTC
jgi:hypothetical protein